jgi:hypothetical protein
MATAEAETPEERARRVVEDALAGYGLPVDEHRSGIDEMAAWLPFRSAMRGARWLVDLGVPVADAAALVDICQVVWVDGPYDERRT